MTKAKSDASPQAQVPTTQHLFWARELVQLSRKEAKKMGVADHVMAQAMLVQAWMLFTGQNEKEAKKAVSGLFSASMAKMIPDKTSALKRETIASPDPKSRTTSKREPGSR